MTVVRPELPPMPERVARLPVDARGYPVPWFVAWIDGKPDFRVIGPGKVDEALSTRRCWICGRTLGRYVAYVIGPMCAVNRTSAEPPSHRDCAVFAATACPFLVRPHMRRRDAGLPEDAVDAPGEAIKRNPGVALVWVTVAIKTKADFDGGRLFDIGKPAEVLWFAQGREATRDEVVASIESGLPTLREMAEEGGRRAVRLLERQTAAAMQLIPADNEGGRDGT